jgi:hypothetical protein
MVMSGALPKKLKIDSGDFERNTDDCLDLPCFTPRNVLSALLPPDLKGAMRKVRFSEEQMVAIIREGDRDPVAADAKRHGISEQRSRINGPVIVGQRP